MDTKKFESDYQKFLKNYFNKKRAVQVKRYLYSDLKHYGISVWQRRKFVKEYKKKLESLTKKEALSLIDFYWKKPSFEERAMAITILNLHASNLTLEDMPLIEKMMRQSKGWALLDSLIIPIMPVILEKYKKGYMYLNKWIKDKDFWVRRSALLAQLELLRKGKGDRDLFFELAESQFDEKWMNEVYKDKFQNQRAKFFIRKAIGWTLRDMSRKNPKIVFDFLKKNKPAMSGLSFREGSRKLSDDIRSKL
jgi:3-methyladenine DNA glycosylase AlkD